VGSEDLEALFKPFGSVTVRRLFGGAGIDDDGLCFGSELKGEVFLKTDEVSRADFCAAGSALFTYMAKSKSRPTSCWSLPTVPHEEGEEMRRWASVGLDAARRVAAAKAMPKNKRPKNRAAAK
jgi:DNA transformation protein